MSVTIQFRGPITNLLNTGTYNVEIDDSASLHGILVALLEKEQEIRETWSDPEALDRETMILVNEVDVGLTGSLATPLKDGDVLEILPLVHGGLD
jgi:molybdopterin converting factor small subunit